MPLTFTFCNGSSGSEEKYTLNNVFSPSNINLCDFFPWKLVNPLGLQLKHQIITKKNIQTLISLPPS